jgi:hypothetical protein
MRESANDCILAIGEGHGSRGETFQPIYVASPVSSSVEHSVFFHTDFAFTVVTSVICCV